MKKITLLLCTATVLLYSCNSGDKDKAPADDKKTGDSANTTTTAPAKPADTTGMSKAWEDFKTPGPMHKWMADASGTWEGEASQWMDPAAPPMKSNVKSVSSMMLNGLYQETKFTGTMMGAPFEGRSIMGYDNGKKMFVSTWWDNMGSGLVNMTGNWDDATKTLNLKGRQTDPMTGKDCDMREEYKVIDADTHLMTLYGTGLDGKEAKFMEVTLKRKK